MTHKNRFFTLLFIPEKDAPKRLSLSRRALMGVLLAGGLWVVAFLGVVGHDVYINTQLDNLSALKLENKILKEKFNDVSQEMTRIEDRLEHMDTLAVKLKLMTNLEDKVSGTPIQNATAHASSAPELLPFYEQDADYVLPKLYQLETQLKQLARYSAGSEDHVQALYEVIEDRYLLLRATPSVLPTRGWISSRFGLRTDPFTGIRRMHTGIDIATHKGSTIHSPADGVITYAGQKPGYGRVLVINHGYGITTRFAHNSQNLVNAGDKVKRGDQIAFVGSSGRSTSSHLHYEVRIHEVPVNPQKYVLDELGSMTTATIKIPRSAIKKL